MSEFKMLDLLNKYNKTNDTYRYEHVLIEIDEGSDGLFALKVTDTSNGAIWWATVCETHQDALAAVKSLFETQAMADLQRQLNKVKIKS